MYKKLGFVEGGDEAEIDLRKFGGEDVHRHVALVREPKVE